MNPLLLQAADVAGGSFLLLAAAMPAASVLLLIGGGWVAPRWSIPVALACLVALVGLGALRSGAASSG